MRGTLPSEELSSKGVHGRSRRRKAGCPRENGVATRAAHASSIDSGNYVALAHSFKINRLRIGPPSESRSEAFCISRSCSRLPVSPGRIMCGWYIIPLISALWVAGALNPARCRENRVTDGATTIPAGRARPRAPAALPLPSPGALKRFVRRPLLVGLLTPLIGGPMSVPGRQETVAVPIART